MELKREFSFSVSRLLSFEFCRRGYFFKYILSWKGWEKYSDPIARKAYYLKNLKKSEQWLEELFKKTARKYIREKILHKTNPNLFLLAKNEFNRAWDESYRNSSEPNYDGKFTSISELHYRKFRSPVLLRNLLIEKFKILIANFADAKILKEYSKLQSLNFHELASPEKIQISNIPVYFSPDFLISRKDEAEITIIYINSYDKIPFWEISAALSAIFAEQRCKAKKILHRSSFFSPEELSVWASSPINESIKLIKEKSAEMISFEKRLNEQYPPKEILEKCPRCNFYEICANIDLKNCTINQNLAKK